MVGNAPEGPINPAQMTPSESKIAPEQLGERLSALPGVERLRGAAADLPAYLVGGAVRDLLLGRDRVDMDVAVEGEVTELARRLGGEVRRHERFATATAAPPATASLRRTLQERQMSSTRAIREARHGRGRVRRHP